MMLSPSPPPPSPPAVESSPASGEAGLEEELHAAREHAASADRTAADPSE
jgi:hypothetical protein